MHQYHHVDYQLHVLEARCDYHLSLQLNQLLARNPEELRLLTAKNGKATEQQAEQPPQVRCKLKLAA